MTKNWKFQFQRSNNMFTVTKDMNIGEILDNARETIPFFLNLGMHCLGCPSARGETVEQACLVHGVDPDEFVAGLNEFIASNTEK